ncbi:MAG: radical SAM family heme chaperone HemW, partial [Dehalococcoidia bacterium]|nr:radical SAM family heme chaperone HemW [Dehalococcoidia bacterium]
GTPTLLNNQQLTHLIELLQGLFSLNREIEITIEANPESIGKLDLRQLASLGVNRLSIGIQSFIDSELTTLGRSHSVSDVLQAYRRSRQAGFGNVNFDLIYGLPHQTLSDWRKTVEQAVDLSPEHLSLYALTIEPHTTLARNISQGLLPEPQPDLAAEMYQTAEQILRVKGYHHYEISNWALPGRECRHNINYWNNGEYIGLGAGAHSHLSNCRFANVESPFEYHRRLHQRKFLTPDGLRAEFLSVTPWQDLARGGWPVATLDYLDRETATLEWLILGLRMTDGLNMMTYPHNGVETIYGDELERLATDGLAERVGNTVRLTAKGRLLSNEVFVRLLQRYKQLRELDENSTLHLS